MKKIAEIFINEGEIVTVTMTFIEGYDVIKKLGVLEVAKASIMQESNKRVALSEYNSEEL